MLDESKQYVEKLKQYEQKPFDYYDLTIEILDPELKQEVEQFDPENFQIEEDEQIE